MIPKEKMVIQELVGVGQRYLVDNSILEEGICLVIIVMLLQVMREVIWLLLGNTVVTRRGKTKRIRHRYKASSTQTPYGNKTAVSVDKETQMTPRKANTPLREGMSEGIDGSIIQTTKTSSKKKKKKKLFFEYDKARLFPAVPGLTEEEMLRRGSTCKDCKKGHYGQVCPCNKCG